MTEEILERHCPSMNRLYLDDSGVAFKGRVLSAMKDCSIQFARFIMESYCQTADGYYYHYQDVDREGYPIKNKIVTDEQLYELFNNHKQK